MFCARCLRMLTLAGLALSLAACHWRISPPPGPSPVSTVDGTVSLTGPLPVFGDYDGEYPLLASIDVGLFRAGTATLEYGGYIYAADNSSYLPLNLQGSLPFRMDFIDRAVPPGDYELVLYAKTPGDEFTGDLVGSYTPLRVSPSVAINLPGNGAEISGQSLNASFTGSAPFAVLHSAMLLSGNSPEYTQPAVLFKPEQSQTGLAAAQLLWNLDSSAIHHGLLSYEVPGLSYQNYGLSYSGLRLRDRDDYLTVSQLEFEAAAPQAQAPDLKVSNAWGPRPFGKSSISGRLILPQPPQAQYYAVEALPSEGKDSAALAVFSLSADDFVIDSLPNAALYRLAWLPAGSVRLRVYALAQEAEQDTLLFEGPVIELSAEGNQMDAVDLEVQP